MTPEEQRQMRHYELNAIEQDRQIAELQRQVDQWKANHDNQVKLKAMLMDRPDLKERAKLVAEMAAEVERLKEACAKEFASVELLSNENERLSSLVESLRMVVVRWNGSCSSSRQVEDTDECIAGWNKRASNFAAERDSLRSLLVQAVGLLRDAKLHWSGLHRTGCSALCYSNKDIRCNCGHEKWKQDIKLLLALPQIAEMKEAK